MQDRSNTHPIAMLAGDAYLAATDATQWQGFLQKLVNASGSRSARMLVLNRDANQVNASLKHNIDDADHRCYVEHFVNTCPWRPELAHKPPGRLYSTYSDFSCDQRQFYRSEFFNDWARPQDIHHGVCGTLYADEHTKVQLLIQRTAGQGPYSSDETQTLNHLVPHLRQAVILSRELTLQRRSTHAALQASQHSALPFLLLDERGQVLYMTADAETLLNAEGPLSLQQRSLKLRSSAAQTRLNALIKDATTSARRQWQAAGGTLTVKRESGAPLSLLITPVHPQLDTFQLGSPSAFAAIFIHDPTSRLQIDPSLLIKLYGLTAAEARVVIDIARGIDPILVAASLGVSKHTVRSQLKSAYGKTGTSRQTELTRLVLTGPACRRTSANADAPLS